MVKAQPTQCYRSRPHISQIRARLSDVSCIQEDTDRDFFMTPNEAKEYGLIDEVIKTKTSDVALPAMPSLG